MADNSFKVNKSLNLNPQSGTPANPASGDIYFDSVANSLAYYNGTAWASLDAVGTLATTANMTSANFIATLVQNTVIKLTGSAANIHGITASFMGKRLSLYNNTSGNITIKHQSATEPTSNNRIVTPTAGDIVLVSGEICSFFYDSTQARWALVSISSNTAASAPATTSSNGLVTLYQAALTPSTPKVLSDGSRDAALGVVGLTANKVAVITATAATNATGITATGDGTGHGGTFTAGSTGIGVRGFGGADQPAIAGYGSPSGVGLTMTNASTIYTTRVQMAGVYGKAFLGTGWSAFGVVGDGERAGAGVAGFGDQVGGVNATGPGVYGFGGANGGTGVKGEGPGFGVDGLGAVAGVRGFGQGTNAPGVIGYAYGSTYATPPNGVGVYGKGYGGSGVYGEGATTSSPGGTFIGGTASIGAIVQGHSTAAGLQATGGETAAGIVAIKGDSATDAITATGDISFSSTSYRVRNMGDPLLSQDAATKAYVDAVFMDWAVANWAQVNTVSAEPWLTAVWCATSDATSGVQGQGRQGWVVVGGNTTIPKCFITPDGGFTLDQSSTIDGITGSNGGNPSAPLSAVCFGNSNDDYTYLVAADMNPATGAGATLHRMQFVSYDFGQTWDDLYDLSNGDGSVQVANAVFYLSRDEQNFSSDGAIWVCTRNASANALVSIRGGAGAILSGAGTGTSIAWGTDSYATQLVEDGTYIVALGGGQAATSASGAYQLASSPYSWVTFNVGTTSECIKLIRTSSRLVALFANGQIRYCSNALGTAPTSWTLATTMSGADGNDMAWDGDSTLVAVGGNQIYFSVDNGVTWTLSAGLQYTATIVPNCVAYGDGHWVVGGNALDSKALILTCSSENLPYTTYGSPHRYWKRRGLTSGNDALANANVTKVFYGHQQFLAIAGTTIYITRAIEAFK